jgi:hypothetical protein
MQTVFFAGFVLLVSFSRRLTADFLRGLGSIKNSFEFDSVSVLIVCNKSKRLTRMTRGELSAINPFEEDFMIQTVARLDFPSKLKRKTLNFHREEG